MSYCRGEKMRLGLFQGVTGCKCTPCQATSLGLGGIHNPYGNTSIGYRIGTHSSFKNRMPRNLRNHPALSDLNLDKTSDFTVALIDVVATVEDVLTFYQERIANECFLRTYKERESAIELSKMVGYFPKPGRAATTYLEFTVEEDVVLKKSGEVVINAGTKAQSIPEQGELPQIFETSEEINARSEWNLIRPQLTKKQSLEEALAKGIIYFSGIENQIKLGDGLLVIDGGIYTFLTVNETIIRPEYQYTEVHVSSVRIHPPPKDYTFSGDMSEGTGEQPTGPDTETAILVPELEPFIITETQVASAAKMTGMTLQEYALSNNDKAGKAAVEGDSKNEIYVFRVKGKIFGHNAPPFEKWTYVPGSLSPWQLECDMDRESPCSPLYFGSNAWEGETTAPPIKLNSYPDSDTSVTPIMEQFKKSVFFSSAKGPHFYMDRVYAEVSQGQFVLLKQYDKEELDNIYQLHRIVEVFERTISDFGITSEVIGLKIFPATTDDEESAYIEFDKFRKRECSVYTGNVRLMLARIPKDPVKESLKMNATTIKLDKMVTGLDGRVVSISGEIIEQAENGQAKQATNIEKAEFRTVARTEIIYDHLDHPDIGYTIIHLDDGLSHEYRLDTVRINANIVSATHGETVEESIGSGRISHSVLRYELSKYPLTYVPAPGPTGVANTLEIKINDDLWRQSMSLHDVDANDVLNSYVLRTDDTGRTSILTDGKRQLTNAGIENINAKYRVGLGLSGMLKANQITIPIDQPLGVKGVTNPLPPTGGVEPEGPDSIRSNIPSKLLAMDRIVSLRDFENFANSIVGISKALATRIISKNRELVHVSIVPTNINDDVNKIINDLIESIQIVRDPNIDFRIQSFREKRFNIKAKIKVSKGKDFENVRPSILHQLRENYSIQTRDLAQGIHSSEIIGFINDLEGVVAVDLDLFYTPYKKELLAFRIIGDIEVPVLDLNDLLKLNLSAIEELITSFEHKNTNSNEFPFNLVGGPKQLLNNINDIKVREDEQEGIVLFIELFGNVPPGWAQQYLEGIYGEGTRLRFSIEIYPDALDRYVLKVKYHVLSSHPENKVIHTYPPYNSWFITLKQRCRFLRARVATLGRPAELLVMNPDEDGIVLEEMK